MSANKFQNIVRAIDSINPRDHGLLLGIATNFAGEDRSKWRRVYEASHRAGIEDLTAAWLSDERPWLEGFHKSVLGQTIDASELLNVIPEGHSALMINPRTMSFVEIVERGQKYFGLQKAHEYKKLSDVRSTAQGRPAEQYVFAHIGSASRDMPGVSYNSAKADRLCFLDSEEYALATLYSKWRHGFWLDVLGWTRLDALWADERVVYAGWRDVCLYFRWGSPGYADARSGPRSAIIL